MLITVSGILGFNHVSVIKTRSGRRLSITYANSSILGTKDMTLANIRGGGGGGTYVLLVLGSFSIKDGWDERLELSSMVVDEDGRFVVVTTLEKVETLGSILGTGRGEGNKGLREKGDDRN